ncbi:hypothetical protein CRG98_022802 [Punica granatum]|uniref:Uncharacterized protein n=1 Tax=Punica granatum TaxID=22663 RepID=A0A2I0JKP8_PUNGR|nr:hypothetical protein CRG98_022802 [Punica granatum]
MSGHTSARAVTGRCLRGEHAHGRVTQSVSACRRAAGALFTREHGECKRARGRGRKDWGKGRLPLGSPWVPRPKRRNWEKSRLSIGRAFELTLKPVMQMWSQSRPRRLKLDFSYCFLSCLGAPEIIVISICRDRTSADLKCTSETFKALLGRSR